MLVFDDDGAEIGDIELSETVAALLERDAEVTVHFHTPRMMVYELGAHNFTFTLRKLGGRATSHDGEQLRSYIRLQRDIRKIMEGLNASAAGAG